jgi:hypothetical protein
MSVKKLGLYPLETRMSEKNRQFKIEFSTEGLPEKTYNLGLLPGGKRP